MKPDRRMELGSGFRPLVGTLPVMLVLAALAVLLYLLRDVLIPFVLAAAIAYVATPAVDGLSTRLRLKRGAVVGIVFPLMVGVGGGIAFLVGSTAVHDVGGLSHRLTENLTLVSTQLAGAGINLLGHQVQLGQMATGLGDDLRRWLDDPARATDALRWGAEALFGGVLTIVLSFYFLLSGRRLARGAVSLAPPRTRPFCRALGQRFDPVLRRYVLGVLAVALYAAVVAWVFIGPVFALPDPLLLALVTGVLEPIPFFGPLLAPIIVGAVALDYGNGATIVGFIIYAVVFRLSIDQVVGPFVLGTAVDLPPSMIILAFLVGWVLFGFVGLFLAVPAAAGLRTALNILYAEESP